MSKRLEQREKQKALRNQMREMHRAGGMFSSQGKGVADPEQTADGMTPASQNIQND